MGVDLGICLPRRPPCLPPSSSLSHTIDDDHSVALALKRGTDINCGDCYTPTNLQKALSMELIAETDLDLALRRTMTQRVELGMLDLLPGELTAPSAAIGPDRVNY